MKQLNNIFGILWRSVLVAFGYLAGIMAAGVLSGLMGWMSSSSATPSNGTTAMLISTGLMGIFTGPIAAKLKISRRQSFILWFCLFFANLGSVALEGAFFAPDLITVPLIVLLFQQAFGTAGAALAVALLFTPHAERSSWTNVLRLRSPISWLWRLCAGVLSYGAFYWIFGGLNYALVTKPYYETHAGGLTVPSTGIVLPLEMLRGLLIVFSVFLLLLSLRGNKKQSILTAGWLLFSVGGIIPLCWQIGTLPLPLLFASAVEIFFQNFLTGVAAALLLRIEVKKEEPIIRVGTIPAGTTE